MPWRAGEQKRERGRDTPRETRRRERSEGTGCTGMHGVWSFLPLSLSNSFSVWIGVRVLRYSAASRRQRKNWLLYGVHTPTAPCRGRRSGGGGDGTRPRPPSDGGSAPPYRLRPLCLRLPLPSLLPFSFIYFTCLKRLCLFHSLTGWSPVGGTPVRVLPSSCIL